MQEQNFKNHSQSVPLFHFFAWPLAGVVFALSLIKLYRNYEAGLGGLLMPLILLGMSVLIVLLMHYTRSFALKAQDRAIRAEENLRYFAMTGNLLDPKLTTRQIIALRFAPNAEFLDLAHRAVAENLSSKQIKEAIKNWRPDTYRV